jgi:hypothetical protein
MDVHVDGRILQSTGREIKLDVTVTDATGSHVVHQGVRSRSGPRALGDTISKPRDP